LVWERYTVGIKNSETQKWRQGERDYFKKIIEGGTKGRER
jgi:hypothetical protein